MKKIQLSIFVILFISTFSEAIIASSEISVVINGHDVSFPDSQPYINADNRTMVPVRFVSEELGATVEWNGDNQQVYIYLDNQQVVLTINSNEIYLNGFKYEIDTLVIIKEDRTFVPLRFVSEYLGKLVEWDAETYTVLVTDYVEAAENETEESEPEIKHIKITEYDTSLEENKYRVDWQVVIDVLYPLENQWQETRDYLSALYDDEIVNTIMDYVMTKTEYEQPLEDEIWVFDGRTFISGSNPKNPLISISSFIQ